MKTISERIAELSPEKRELFTLLLGNKEPEQSGTTITAGRRDNGALPLSFAQQRLWFLDQLEPGTAFYNLPAAVRLRGVLDLSALARGFAELVRRHETLRTTFRVVGEQPEQVISPALAPGLPFLDLSHLDVAGREAQVARLAREEAQLPFDLAAGPLLRLRVLRLAEEEHVLLLTMHHIVSDGWSMGVLIKEVITLYSAYSQGLPSPLPDLPVQYADYAIWQREYLTGELLEQQLDYWRKQLKRVAKLELPRDRPRRSERSYRGASVGFKLTEELTQSLLELSERAGATLFMTLLAAFQTLLHRYTNQRDISVGTPIANRNRAEIEGLIGFFVNTLVMRTDFSGDPTFVQLLGRVRETALDVYANQDVPFERLVEELQAERDLSHSPLFQVLFTMHNAPARKAELPGLELEVLERQIQFATFDLSLVIDELHEGVSGLLTGSLDLFEPEKLHRFVEHYEVLLKSIVVDPEQKISQLPILSDAERQRLLVEWNDTRSATLDEHLIHQAVEAKAAQTPEAVAVLHEGEQLTYSELNRRANQLARRLRHSGIGPEERVIILMERSPEMLIALLGVLKAGGAYVPLDTNLPSERLAFILNDVSAKTLLTQQTLKASLPQQGAEVICLDADWETIALEDGANLPCEVSAENLAYVIYTSGSTGEPKGVMVQHGSIKNYVETAIAEFGLEASDRVLQFASLSFDTSAEEIYPTLTAGATLLLRNDAMLASASTFFGTCRDWGVTVLDLPTAYWHELVLNMSAEHRELLGQVRLVIVGGERALSQRLENWQRYASGVRLLNGYGPTETTVVVTLGEVTERPHSSGEIPIGRPIQNVQLYVLDGQMQLAPTGVPGELYVGGAALSRGYFEQPSLTAQAFIPHRFSKIGGERLYRTGDVVKYRADGELEYVGRVDRQVKIRGFRIELGEVEAALCALAGVHDAVVLAKERDDDDKQLVAYVVANSNADDDMRAGAEATIEHVAHWQDIFNELYREFDPEQSAKFYIKGWDSSYTGQPMSAEEVDEWMSHTVERILSLKPKRLKELGCGGSGLMLFGVAPHCHTYVATDVSRNALSILHSQLSAMEAPIPGVSLRHCGADEYEESELNFYDAVICVSVAQYFPSIEYLMKVLEGAVKVLRPGGFIFLGDVRNHTLLDVFHTSVQLHQAKPSLTTVELTERIRRRLALENQLTVDPGFFTVIRERLPQISDVQIRLLRGHHRNELTAFRYDVVMRCGNSPEVGAQTSMSVLDWTEAGLTLESVRQLLEENEPAVQVIGSVPNARVLADWQAMKLLTQENGPATVGALRDALATGEANGFEPEAFWELGKELFYNVEIRWSRGKKDGAYDVIFTRKMPGRGVVVGQIHRPKDQRVKLKPWKEYANAPARKVDAGKLVASLKAALGQMLPAYMVPQAFIMLDELPLTPSSKIDYRRLPEPGQGRPTLFGDYVAPRSAIEQILARIWAELLHVERVGLNDNFFDLGGHSLLATRLIARLRSVLSVELPLRAVFETPTLVGLTEIVLQQAGQRARIEKTAELLLEFEQLSEGEAGRMLEEVIVSTSEREAR